MNEGNFQNIFPKGARIGSDLHLLNQIIRLDNLEIILRQKQRDAIAVSSLKSFIMTIFIYSLVIGKKRIRYF